MLSHISASFQSEKYGDVTVIVTNDRGDVLWSRRLHKLVLTQSPFFEARFDRWSDAPQIEVVVDVSVPVIEKTFQLFYDPTSSLELPINQLLELVEISSFFLMEEQTKNIVHKITKQLTLDNLFECVKTQNGTLLKSCRNFLLQNGYDGFASKLIAPESWYFCTLLRRELEFLIECLTHKAFWTPNEFEKYRLVAAIAKNLGEDGREFFNRISSSIYLFDLSPSQKFIVEQDGFLNVEEIQKRYDRMMTSIVTEGRIKPHPDFKIFRFGSAIKRGLCASKKCVEFVGSEWELAIEMVDFVNISLTKRESKGKFRDCREGIDLSLNMYVIGLTKIYHLDNVKRSNEMEKYAFSSWRWEFKISKQELDPFISAEQTLKVMVSIEF